jgi:hypothetical protein
MLQQSTYIEIDLKIREAVSLLRVKNCVLHCVSGRLWVTEENGGGDIVLNAGDTHLLTRRGQTVVQSVEKQSGARFRLLLVRSPLRIVDARCRRMAALIRMSPSGRLVRPPEALV